MDAVQFQKASCERATIQIINYNQRALKTLRANCGMRYGDNLQIIIFAAYRSTVAFFPILDFVLHLLFNILMCSQAAKNVVRYCTGIS